VFVIRGSYLHANACISLFRRSTDFERQFAYSRSTVFPVCLYSVHITHSCTRFIRSRFRMLVFGYYISRLAHHSPLISHTASVSEMLHAEMITVNRERKSGAIRAIAQLRQFSGI